MIRDTSDIWWKNAIIYCLDIETFKDSNADGCGDISGLIEKIDYLAGIGVTCIWLMPFYVSPQLDDGYDIADFYSIQPELGDLGDFTDMVRTARDRGIRVIADLVVNHTSEEHPWFLSARADRDSPYRDFYIWAEEPPEDADEGVMFPGQQDSRWGYAEETDSHYLHSFYSHQPDLNFANEEVRSEVAKMIGFWIQQGLSGFRVDAVPFLVDTDDLPEGVEVETHGYVAALRDFLGRRTGDAILLGEVNVEPADQEKFLRTEEHGEQLHMIFDFPLNQSLYLALARTSTEPITQVLGARPSAPDAAAFANFVRNHDELSLDKLSEKERKEVFEAFGPDEDMQVFGRGLRRRLPPMVGGDPRKLRMIYSLMFSLPGAPVLFYGEEIGMGENLDIDGRTAVRTPMQWGPGPTGGFSHADPSELCRPLPEGEFGPDEVNVSEQRRDPDSLLNWMEKLMRERRECPEIGWGDWELIEGVGSPVLGIRYDWKGRVLVALHNLSSEDQEVRLRLNEDETLHDLFRGRSYDASDDVFEMTLEPFDYRWLRVEAAQEPGDPEDPKN